jgi:hypothetical protein
MSAQCVLTAAVSKVSRALVARGFKRKRRTFVRRGVDDVMSLIQIQASRRSTAAELVFVVNFGVVVPVLYVGEDLHNPAFGGWHWGRRIADERGVEIWWSVRADADADDLAARLTSRIEREVLPALDALQREEDLIELRRRGAVQVSRMPSVYSCSARYFIALDDERSFCRSRQGSRVSHVIPFRDVRWPNSRNSMVSRDSRGGSEGPDIEHAGVGRDVFLSPFDILRTRDGMEFSYCTWPEGVFAWLPRTECIGLHGEAS